MDAYAAITMTGVAPDLPWAKNSLTMPSGFEDLPWPPLAGVAPSALLTHTLCTLSFIAYNVPFAGLITVVGAMSGKACDDLKRMMWIRDGYVSDDAFFVSDSSVICRIACYCSCTAAAPLFCTFDTT